MSNTIRIKRGIEANLKDAVLQNGELAFKTDTRKLFIGLDGEKICIGKEQDAETK